MSLVNYHNIINPHARVHAGGWRSTVGELSHNGWIIETSYRPEYMAVDFVMRNPSKYMVGHCMIEEGHMKMLSRDGYPIAYMDESLLLKAEFYQEIRIPKIDLYPVSIEEPIRPLYDLRGTEDEWRKYTPDEGSDIIVTLDKVPMLLDEIRKAQEPRAKEIIHSQRKRGSKIITQAKILSFG